MKKSLRKIFEIIAVAAFWLLVWYLTALAVGNPLLVPMPHTVLKTFGGLLITPRFYLSLLMSFLTIFAGFLAANVLGIVLGALSYAFVPVRKILEPAVSAVKATPVASFIILLLVWVGKGAAPMLTSLLMVFPVVWQSVVTGLSGRDTKLLEVAKIYDFNLRQRLNYVYLPAVLRGYVAAVKTGLGLAWKAGVAAEVLANTRNTLGGAIYESKLYLEIPELFAWTVAVILISILIEKITVFIIGKITGKAV